MGAITAHYGVEGQGFYGIPLDKFLPYAITRTWHLQIAIFWIATSWLATGLYVGPAVSGQEPKYQRLGVNVLFVALVLVVVGSLAGEWLGIQQKLGNLWFWFGAQGYEYVDLGRFWQILLFVGLVLLVVPDVCGRSNRRSEARAKTIRCCAVPGLEHRDPAVLRGGPDVRTAQPPRDGRILALVGGSPLGGRLLRSVRHRGDRVPLHAAEAALDSHGHQAPCCSRPSIFLSGGIIGTFHHLYFAGRPTSVLALGAVFSALEVVPLVLIGFEAWENIRLARPTAKAPWIANYKWPIYFFVAVAFWNLVGAGLFGFLINPPIALYYMQGLNTDAGTRAHSAVRSVRNAWARSDALLPPGIAARAALEGRHAQGFVLVHQPWPVFMVVLSMFPIGVMQAMASIEYGTWYARSAEFLQTPTMQFLRWMRVPGDVLFAAGAAMLGWFVLGLLTGHSFEKGSPRNAKAIEAEERELVAQ